MKIFAVLPVYNENPEKLSQLLEKLKNFVDEVVVVDDGSKTVISNQLTGNKGKIVILRHQINRGQGAALQTGTDYAIREGADIIVHLDSDGQHRPEDIPALIRPIQEDKVDFVFGSKFLGQYNKIPWTKKYIIVPIARIINYIFTGLELSDAHNGMRAFSAKVAHEVYIAQDKMAHNTEYSYLVKKNNIKYTEVPVKVIYHEYGQGIGGGVRILKELVMGKILK
ncbi:MAG: glycosyltransferase family 2 protein [Candidatus Kuenenbacteria bacterium]